MNIKKFLSLIILGSLFYNQFSLCMFKKKKVNEEEKQYLLKEIVIQNSPKSSKIEKKFEKDNLCSLPDEVLLKVFGFLSNEENIRGRLVNKEFDKIYKFYLDKLKVCWFRAKGDLFDQDIKGSKKDFNAMISYIKKMGKRLSERSEEDKRERCIKILAQDKLFFANINDNCGTSNKNIKRMVKNLHKLRYWPPFCMRCISNCERVESKNAYGSLCLFVGFFMILFLVVFFGLSFIEDYFSPCSSPDVYGHTNSTMYENCVKKCEEFALHMYCKFYK
ncbi:hypothetical protein ACFLYA_01725 [Candidatus Dependentiae bacterium]